MNVRVLQVKTFTETDLATLESSIQTWFDAAGEKEFVELHYEIDGTNYTALILFTE